MKNFYLNFIAIFLLGITSLSAQNTDGTDFWLTFGYNWRDGSESNVLPKIRIVSKDLPTTGKIVLTGLPETSPFKTINFSIPARSVFDTTFNYTQKAVTYLTTQGTYNYSVHITSNNPVTAYALNQCKKSADATNLLPVPALGKDYYQISYPAKDNFRDAYAVIATEDGTNVWHDGALVTPTPLPVGQVYYRTSIQNGDMTGAHITSDKPVAFFALCQGTSIAYTSSKDCLFQQLAPVNTWGKKFLIPVTNIYNVFGTSSKDRVRIVASRNNTTVRRYGGAHIDGTGGQLGPGPVYTLNAGKFIELEVDYANKGCYIEADSAVGVCTYLITPTSASYDSDPGQAWLTSMEQTATNALIAPFAPPNNTALTTHKALILAPFSTKDKTKVTIGSGIQEGLSGGVWMDNVESGMSFYNYPMTDKTKSYRFNNPGGIIVMGYGYGSAESYYYLGYSSMLNLSAYFTADTIRNEYLQDSIFCDRSNNIEIVAKVTDMSTSSPHLKWWLNNVEQLSLQDHDSWPLPHIIGNHSIKMWVLFADGTFDTIRGTVNIGAHISISPNPADESGGTVSPADTCVKVGESLTLIATPESSYIFLGWTVGSDTISKSETFTFTVTKDSVIVGNFRMNNFDVEVSASPPEGGTVTGGGNIPFDTEITVKAIPAYCYKFLYWMEADTIVLGADTVYTFEVKGNRDLIAYFAKLKYDITVETNPATPAFTAQGGELQKDCGTQVTVSTENVTCYKFLGWTNANIPPDTVSKDLSFTFTLENDTALTANFAILPYTVTLYSDPIKGTVDGDGVYDCGDEATITAYPTSCYTFLKWINEKGDSITNQNPYTFTVTQDTVLTANYKLKTFNVSVTPAPAVGDNYATGSATGIDCGTPITVEAFADDCYNFIKWTTLSGDSVTNVNPYTFILAQDSTLIAKFKIKTYSVDIALIVNPSGSGTTSGGGIIPCEEDATVTAVPDSCHTFVNWTIGGVEISTSATYTFMVTGDRVLTANFKRKTFDLAVSANPPVGNNTVTGSGTDIDCGTTRTITATVDECYTFVNWTKGGVPVSTNLTHTFILNGDSTYVANYAIKKYNVSVQTNTPAVTGNVVTDNYTDVNCGDTRSFTATNDPCYTFVNWTDQHGTVVSTNPNFTLTVKGDSTLTANFTIRKYNVIVSMNPILGAGTVTGGVTNVNCGTSVTVTATPDLCYTFVNWTEGATVVSINASYTFNIGAHRDLKANFKIKLFNITALKNTLTNNHVFGSQIDVPCGNSVCLTATPDIFHNFVDWTDDYGTVISTNVNPCITVKNDTVLTANFTPKTYTINVSAYPTTPLVGGSATGAGTDIPYNTSWTVTATPNTPLFKFSHWEDYGTKVSGAGATYTFPVTGDRNLVAVFAKEKVIIKVIAEPDTGGIAYQSAYKVALDSLCYVWITPSLCSHFTKWTTLDNTTFTVNDTLWVTVYPLFYSHIIDSVLTLVAHFELNEYEVTLEPSPPHGGDVYLNGSIFGEDTFSCGTEVEIKAVANHPKYKFVKWVEVMGTDTTWLTNDSIYTFPVTRPYKLVAVFELEKYQITVLPAPFGAGWAWNSELLFYDTKDTVHAEPFNEWTFYKWTEDYSLVDGGTVVSNNKDYDFTVTRDRLLYANFIPKTFTVKVVESPPGIGGIVTGNGTNIDYGTLWDITADPYPTYEFSHWEETGTGISFPSWSAHHSIVVTQDFDLTAVFVLKQYEITTEAHPPVGGITWGDGTFEHGTVITVEAMDTSSCHTFSHWTEDGVTVGSLPALTFTVTGPRHLVAHFTPQMYNITLTSNPLGGGILTGEGSHPCLSKITVSAEPDECYDFENWTEGGTVVCSTPDYTFTMYGPRDLVANFIQKTFNLTTSVFPLVAPPGSGTVTVSGGSDKDIPCGEDRTATAIPEIGYVFIYWIINGTDTVYPNPHIITVKQDKDVVAHFAYTEHAITLYADPVAGAANTSGSYPHGLLLPVIATQNPGWVFVNWTEFDDDLAMDVTVSTNATYTFLVDRPRTLTAHFDTAKLTVITVPAPLNGGTTTPLITTDIPYETFHTVTAEPKECFMFDHWSIDGVWKSYDISYTFPVTQSCTLVAHFKKETHNIVLKVNPSLPPGGNADFINVVSGYNIPCGDTIVIQATPNPDYEFVDWTINGVSKSLFATYSFAVLQSDTLTANFTLKKYNVLLSVASGGGGNVWHTPQNNIPHGTMIEIHAQANECYKFLHWTEYGSTIPVFYVPEPPPFPVHKSMHLVAHFEKETFDIIPWPNPPYGGTAKDTAYNVACKTYYEVHAQEKLPFFMFDGWWENGIKVYPFRDYGFTVSKPHTLEARFITVSFEIEVSVNPNGGGTVCCSGAYDYGSTVPFTVVEDPCYDFVGWYEDGVFLNNDNPFLFTVDGPHHFVAHFEQKLFNITTAVTPIVAPPGSGYVTITGGGDTDIPCGEDRTATAIPEIGYVFIYWIINGTDTVYPNPHIITVKQDKDVVAHFEYTEHLITLAPNYYIRGQVWTTPATYPHGTDIVVHAKPNSGYKFIKWTEDDLWVYGDTAYPFTVNRPRHLIAVFDSATYTVHTEPNNTLFGWTEPQDTTGLAYQTPLTVKAFEKPNFTFKHWMENGMPINGTDSTYTFAVTKDRNLIAVFEPKKYNITLGVNPHGTGQVSGGGYNLPYGSTVEIRAKAFPCYEFENWTNEMGDIIYYSDTTDHLVQKTEHLTANFIPKKYDILVSATTGGSAYDSHFNVPCKDEVTIHAVPDPGYVFDGWYENNGYINKILDWTITVTGTRELEARFVKGKYTVLLKANPPKGGTVNGGGFNFEYGDVIPIAAIEKQPCYNFVEWTDETGTVVSSNATDNWTVLKSDTLTANFSTLTSKITLISNPLGAGILTADGWMGGGDMPQCDTITIAAEPDNCYTFDKWTENGVLYKTTPSFDIIMDENDRTFVAHFTQKHINITVAASPPNGGTVAGGGTNIPCGEMVIVEAIPNTAMGYSFVNWTINGVEESTDPVYTFKTTQTCELVANFSLIKYTITVLASPPNMGSVSGNGTFEHGYPHTVHAMPLPGYMFVNWTENGNEVSKLADYPFIVTASRTLVANFETTYYTLTVRSNDTLYGIATLQGHPADTGKFEENQTATVIAAVKQGYRFLNWTENGNIVAQTAVYEFPVTKDMTLVANFYGLDFDTYAATLWDNTFLLDLKKLEGEGLNITACKWFKNTKEEKITHTINQFSYSAGPKVTDKLELDPTYYSFQLTTKNGSMLYSTKKILPYHQYFQTPANNNLYIYPNPASSGSTFTVENAIAETLMQVYNQYGVCVKTLMTTSETVTLSLDLPAGIYLIRNENKEGKVIIVR